MKPKGLLAVSGSLREERTLRGIAQALKRSRADCSRGGHEDCRQLTGPKEPVGRRQIGRLDQMRSPCLQT